MFQTPVPSLKFVLLISITWVFSLLSCRLRRQFELTFVKGSLTISNESQRDIFLHDCFIVRYDAERQRYLPPHYDESTISFIIPLNSDFIGGGTFIYSLGKTLAPKIGGVMSFCGGDLLHSGDPIVSGVRYIIAGFCYVDLVDSGGTDCTGHQIIQCYKNNSASTAAPLATSQTFSFGFDL